MPFASKMAMMPSHCPGGTCVETNVFNSSHLTAYRNAHASHTCDVWTGMVHVRSVRLRMRRLRMRTLRCVCVGTSICDACAPVCDNARTNGCTRCDYTLVCSHHVASSDGRSIVDAHVRYQSVRVAECVRECVRGCATNARCFTTTDSTIPYQHRSIRRPSPDRLMGFFSVGFCFLPCLFVSGGETPGARSSDSRSGSSNADRQTCLSVHHTMLALHGISNPCRT